MKKNKDIIVRLLPALGFILLILCLITKSDALLIATAIYSGICVAVCCALAGREDKKGEK